MAASKPNVVIIGGPNGAGKSTAGPALLRDLLGIRIFVNADRIAEGMAAYNPESAAMAAGRVMLTRIRELVDSRRTFAFETTLASRTFAPWIRKCMKLGYDFHVIYLWLPSPEFAMERVRDRVRLGGHNVPQATIRRRYKSGLQNFSRLYQPLAQSWRVYDNSRGGSPRLVASGLRGEPTEIMDALAWKKIEEKIRL